MRIAVVGTSGSGKTSFARTFYRAVIRTLRRNRRQYPALLSRPEYAHLDARQFTRPVQATAYLAGLHRDAAPGGTVSTQ